MKYVPAILVLFICSAAPGWAQLVVNFTAEEGYVDGPVHRQPSEGDQWREPRPGSFSVNVADGTLTFDSSADNWTKATYSKSLGFGMTYILAIDFQVTIGSPMLKDGNSILNRFQLGNSDGFVSASVRQRGDKPDLFDIWLFENVGEKPPESRQSAVFSGEQIGLKARKDGKAYKDNVSDRLRLILIHRYTGEDLKFTSVAALINVDTETEILKVGLPGWTGTEAWLKSPDKDFSISTGNMNEKLSDDGATSIAIRSIKIGVAQE